jgi:hypothetical protein
MTYLLIVAAIITAFFMFNTNVLYNVVYDLLDALIETSKKVIAKVLGI